MSNKIRCIFRILVVFIVFTIFKTSTVFAIQLPASNGGGSDGSALNLSIGYIDGYLKAFGGVAVFAAVALVGLRMVLLHNRPEERADSMAAILHIALGAFIIGAALLIAGFLIGTENHMLDSFSKSVETADSKKNTEMSDDSNFMSRALSVPLNAVIDTILGDGEKDGIQKLMGFKAIDKLIFNDGAVTGTEPFSSKEWNSLDYLYLMFIGITSPFILIMVAKTGFSAIKNSNSVTKRIGLKDDIGRWFFSLFVIAAAPVFFRGIVCFFNLMSSAIYQNIIIPTSVSNSSLSIDATSIQKIKTGNVFSTAIVKVIFCYLDVKINIVFLARKIMLSVMYVFTPLAACLWGINRNVNAASIWFGEIITNSAMAFFYGITYTVMCVMINATGATGWFFTMMWMFSMMKISEVLRNSLQGLFCRLSGVNEEDMSKGASGVVGGALMAAKKKTKAVVSSVRRTSGGSYSGSGTTSDAKGNTNYSAMKGKGMERHNNINIDPRKVNHKEKQNPSSSTDAGYKESRNCESNIAAGTSNKRVNPSTGIDNEEKIEPSDTNSQDTISFKDTHNGEDIGKQYHIAHAQSPLEQLSLHRQYYHMLHDNYDNEVGKNGQRNCDMGMNSSGFLNGTEHVNRIKNTQVRKNAAAHAITSTVNRMVQDSQNKNSSLYKINGRPINEKEATKILFGNENTDRNKKGFIRNARINNINGSKEILASTNPYISADTNFKWN
ncbi:hypothetical protein [Clostridium oryzae]|nr:hypothetical protein [Clostridium oryzae]